MWVIHQSLLRDQRLKACFYPFQERLTLDNGTIAITFIRKKLGIEKASIYTLACRFDWVLILNHYSHPRLFEISKSCILLFSPTTVMCSRYTNSPNFVQQRFEIWGIKSRITSHSAIRGGASFAAQR